MRILLAFALWLAATPVLARPTSGDMSIASGRTMGTGEEVIAAALGWPGIWAQYLGAPSSTFNVGFRGNVLYGSPVMGVGSGVGAEATVPLRFHLWGADMLDVALQLEPSFFVGEGALAGEEAGFGAELALGGQAQAALLGGARVSDVVTLTLGLGGGLAVTNVDGRGTEVVGTTLFHLAVEALMSRDTMLFGEVRAGWGFAPDLLYDGHGIIRVSLGLAYLM